MSDPRFDSYLGVLSRLLRLSARQREAIRRELLDHLEQSVEEHQARGASRDEAIRRAIEEFGDAAELAARFSNLGLRKRWMMKGTIAAACVGAALLGFRGFDPIWRGFTAIAPQTAATAAGAARGQDAAKPDAPSARASDGRSARETPDSASARVRAGLARVLPEINLSEVPLDGALTFIAEMSNANLHVQWGRLGSVGIDRDASVTVSQLKSVTVERVLRLILDEFEDGRLGYEVQDGILIISTAESLMRPTETHVYDVADILERALAGTARASANDESPRPATPDRGASPVPSNRERLSESLVKLVRAAVAPDTWGDEGDGRGFAQIFNDRLVVRHCEAVHVQITSLLEGLRRSNGPTARTEAATSPASPAAR